MSITKYNALLKVLEHNSITKAADDIGYTQSGISYMIKTLENEFGLPLLIRSKEGVVPTENALRLKPIIQKLLNAQQELEDTVNELTHRSLGTIRIGSYNSMLLTWIPQILKKFSVKFPDVDISLVEGTDPELNEMLKNGTIDIAFTAGSTPSGFKFMKLADDPFLAVLPADHPLAGKQRLSINDLSGCKTVLPEESYYNWLTSYLDSHGTPASGLKYQLKDSTSILSMVANDLAISVLPRRSLQTLPENVVLREFEDGHSRVLGITYPDSKEVSAVISEFLSIAREVICKSEK